MDDDQDLGRRTIAIPRTKLTLEDTVYVLGVEPLKVSIPFELQQMSWLVRSFNSIKKYSGKSVNVSQIDDQLDNLGRREEIAGISDWYPGQLLSLRVVNMGDQQSQIIPGFDRGSRTFQGYPWEQLVDYRLVFLTNDNYNNRLAVGVATRIDKSTQIPSTLIVGSISYRR